MNTDTRVIIVVSCIFLVILGGIYLIYKAQQKQIEEVAFSYNGFNLKKVSTGYKVEIFINENSNPNYFTVRADPRDIESIPVEIDTESLKEKKQIYAVIDPYENLTGITTMAALQLENVIENKFLFNIPLSSAFTREYRNKTMETKTCNDVNQTVGIIWLRLGEATRIFNEDKCIVIEGQKEEDLIKAANRLTLTMLGVMKK